jgi:HSP20 family protein
MTDRFYHPQPEVAGVPAWRGAGQMRKQTEGGFQMANLTVRDPFDLNTTFGQFRQMMDRVFEDSPAWRMGPAFFEEGTLPVDIYEKDGRIWVEASVPGFTQDDIDVQVHEGVLSITARKTQESEEQGERWYRRERRYGALSRRIALPGIVDDAQVEAVLEHGVLRLGVPLPEKAQPKRIEIKASANGAPQQVTAGTANGA